MKLFAAVNIKRIMFSSQRRVAVLLLIIVPGTLAVQCDGPLEVDLDEEVEESVAMAKSYEGDVRWKRNLDMTNR